MLTNIYNEDNNISFTRLMKTIKVETCSQVIVHNNKTKLNSVALVRERTIRTERPPLVVEVSANFCG
jgi:hypothetical protein